jgi:hypothetical protein
MQDKIKNKAIKKGLGKDGKKLMDDDEDSDVSINSDNTKEEGAKFNQMDEREKALHVQEMWKIAVSKSRARVHVIKLFTDIQNNLLLFGTKRHIENEKQKLYLFTFFFQQISLRSSGTLSSSGS